MIPAIERPELKVYWLVVPLGHTEPGTVDDPSESVQICPLESRPHTTWFTLSAPPERAKSRNPVFLTLGSGFTADATDTLVASPIATRHVSSTLR